ncbi:MAG: hypothetical protein ACKO4A_18005 [Gammaproteobacteria bacterium]
MSAEQITPTRLRRDLFKVLDRVAETGRPVEIRRGKHRLALIRDDAGSRLSRIVPLKGLIVGDPDALFDSGQEWSEEPGR